jgi:hypothetical protein
MRDRRKSKSVIDLLYATKVTVSPWSISATGIAAVFIALAFLALALLQAGISLGTLRETGVQLAYYISSLWCSACAGRTAAP